MEWEMESRAVWLSPPAYWVAVAVVVALTALGLALNAVILRKAGYHWLWAILFLFPLAYVIGVWVFAWARWPRLAVVPAVRGEGRPPTLGPEPTPRRGSGARQGL